MKNVAFASIQELRALLDSKKITPQELYQLSAQRIAQYDPALGSVLETFNEQSVLESSTGQGLLAGIPGLIKDNICQDGRITSCASKILANYVAPYDATVIERLKNAGALLMGRANMDEFAMGSSTSTSAIKPCSNPWDLSRSPGGSSGGSIAAVAAGFVPWALGSETGGSVRQPAAFCNVVGLKPTYGLVSRYGLIAYGSSLDQISVATRTVYDNALVLSVIAGHDTKDATSRTEIHNPDYTKDLTGKLKPGLKIGIVTNAFEGEGFDPEVQKLLGDVRVQLEKLGATFVPVRLPTMNHSAAVYFIVSRAEASSNLARFDGVKYGYRAPGVQSLGDMYTQTRGEGFGDEVKKRILIGTYVLSAGYGDAYYKSATLVRQMMRDEFNAALNDVDVLFLPTIAAPAFKHGAFAENALQMDLQDYFTASANLTGLPAISVPCGFTSEGLPVGYQLMGRALDEALLFQTAYAYEQSTDWHTRHPKNFA